MEMSIELAIHELSREELGLLDLDLQGDSNPSDGIPADFIGTIVIILRMALLLRTD